MTREVEIDSETAEAINELGNTFDSVDDVLKRLIREAGHAELLESGEESRDSIILDDENQAPKSLLSNKYELILYSNGEHIKRIGGKNQSKAIANAVDYLIEEHDLISEIDIPYVPGRKKAVINDQPTYANGEDEMRHHKKLKQGYYLDTHYQKEDKMQRMREIANECGLEVKFGGGWK